MWSSVSRSPSTRWCSRSRTSRSPSRRSFRRRSRGQTPPLPTPRSRRQPLWVAPRPPRSPTSSTAPPTRTQAKRPVGKPPLNSAFFILLSLFLFSALNTWSPFSFPSFVYSFYISLKNIFSSIKEFHFYKSHKEKMHNRSFIWQLCMPLSFITFFFISTNLILYFFFKSIGPSRREQFFFTLNHFLPY